MLHKIAIFIGLAILAAWLIFMYILLVEISKEYKNMHEEEEDDNTGKGDEE